jgi:hypothetical protein
MVDLNAHEAGNGGQSQGKPTARGVLLYSEGRDSVKQEKPGARFGGASAEAPERG